MPIQDRTRGGSVRASLAPLDYGYCPGIGGQGVPGAQVGTGFPSARRMGLAFAAVNTPVCIAVMTRDNTTPAVTNRIAFNIGLLLLWPYANPESLHRGLTSPGCSLFATFWLKDQDFTAIASKPLKTKS